MYIVDNMLTSLKTFLSIGSFFLCKGANWARFKWSGKVDVRTVKFIGSVLLSAQFDNFTRQLTNMLPFLPGIYQNISKPCFHQHMKI